MANIVFILGAGASKADGCPLMAEFFDRANRLASAGRLSSELSRDVELVEAVRERLQRASYKSRFDDLNLESVFNAIEMGILIGNIADLDRNALRRTRAALVRVISATFENSLEFECDSSFNPQEFKSEYRPAKYVTLANLLKRLAKDHDNRPADDVSVLTFNYDVGLEAALEATKAQFNVVVDESELQAATILICKLHGSLNWYLRNDGASNHAEQIKVVAPILQLVRSTRHGTRNGNAFVQAARQNSNDMDAYSIEPLIVPPTDSKGEHHNKLSAVWRTAAKKLSSATHIVVIGYSLPETDYFFRTFFSVATISRTDFQQFIVIDPANVVSDRFRTLLGVNFEQRFARCELDLSNGTQTFMGARFANRNWTHLLGI